MNEYEEVWSFATRNFRVAFEVAPEDTDPRDSFDREEDIALACQGGSNWFCARVVVYGPDGAELGVDHLGGCSYSSFEDFYQSHRDKNPMHRNCSIMRAVRGENVSIGYYFPDMVSGAIGEARKTLARVQSIKMRT